MLAAEEAEVRLAPGTLTRVLDDYCSLVEDISVVLQTKSIEEVLPMFKHGQNKYALLQTRKRF